MKQSGGFIGVDSQCGGGTTLRLYFPRSEVQRPARPATPLTAARPGTETILLVEDEAMVRTLTRRILQQHGFRVLEAADGAEALRISEQYAGLIAMVLTDVVMPNIGGREAADRLQLMRPGIRVLFMSGYSDDAMLQREALHQKVAFIAKPFRPDALVSAVCAVLDDPKKVGAAPPRTA